MLHKNTIDDVVLALNAAPIDPRTGNKVLYSVDWVADDESMIGKVNPDWVRRELAWFNSGSRYLADMEGPVPKLFQACAGAGGEVNSAYGYILFNEEAVTEGDKYGTIYDRLVQRFHREGLGTRHGVAIITDRDIHRMATLNGRNDFICTNALNVMVDQENRLHIIAQMRSMDAVFGYRADFSMWEDLQHRLIQDISTPNDRVVAGDITFQVANLHVYPRHFAMLADTAYDIEERLSRRVWDPRPVADVHFREPQGTGEAR
jgi:thymidylate synthase